MHRPTVPRLVFHFFALVLTGLLAAAPAGCGPSTPRYPKVPKLRIEGKAGAPVGYSLTYTDGPGNVDFTGTIKTIPPSGVYTEDLKPGHRGLLIEVVPQGNDIVTLILFDDEKEVRRTTARGENQTAKIQAGKVTLPGPFRP
jgi:hypothetical protein